LKAAYARVDQAAGLHGWPTSYLSNHDNPRAVSHFGDDSLAWRERSAKVLATLLLTQRGTPFLYQGDELGMTNYPFCRVDEYDDVEIRGQWRQLVETGQVPAAEYLEHVRQTSRDNARTPMQWNAEAHGGFTTGQPWLAVNPNHVEINAAAQLDDPDSVFHYHRHLIALRHETPALVHGAYLDIDPKNEQVFAYTRTLEDERYLVVLNFGARPLKYALPAGLRIGRAVLDSGSGDAAIVGATQLSLAPWQATIYQLE
jgi:oligo-1,6-glucosidase